MAEKKTGKELHIRGAENWAEYEGMVDNSTESFSAWGIGREPFYYVNRFSPGYRLADTRVGIVNGEIACSLNILRRKICFCKNRIPAGCIADVNVVEKYRGLGYGIALLEDAVCYMKSQGMLISLLFSDKHNFYRRLGWRPIPMPEYILETGAEAFPVPARYKVKEAVLEDALDFLEMIYTSHESEYNGEVHRDRHYWKSIRKWYFTKKPICYIAHEKKSKVSVCFLKEKKNALWIHEARHLPGHDESPKNLLAAALSHARQNGLDAVIGLIPETHPMAVKTILLGGRRELQDELMGLVLDAPALTHKFKEQAFNLNNSDSGNVWDVIYGDNSAFWHIDAF